MRKMITILLVLLLSSGILLATDFSTWSQADYETYMQLLDKKIEHSSGKTKTKYINIKKMIINIYRLGREREYHICPDRQDHRRKSSERKESA